MAHSFFRLQQSLRLRERRVSARSLQESGRMREQKSRQQLIRKKRALRSHCEREGERERDTHSDRKAPVNE